MKQGFPLNDKIPATFRDAMLATMALGIRYLWIDSLCIIQDDDHDWAVESSKMSDVYANSFLTLAVAASEDDAKGFLTARKQSYVILNLSLSTGKNSRIYLQSEEDLLQYELNTKNHLKTRAWTIQEEFLSHRCLIFSSTYIGWQCRYNVKKEYNHKISRTESVDLLSGNAAFSMGGYNDWYHKLSEFTTRDLTYDTDKLPALAGLATYMAALTGDRYLAGIWHSSIPHGLLWYRPAHTTLNPPSEVLGPSWSWCSLNGFIWVQYGFNGVKAPQPLKSFEFLDNFVQPLSENRFGKVLPGAWLKLKAPVVLLSLSDPRDHAKLDRRHVELVGSLETAFKFAQYNKRNVDVKGNFDLRGTNTGDTFALALMYCSSKEAEGNADLEAKVIGRYVVLLGLLIHKTHQSPDGYIRVGYFNTTWINRQAATRILRDRQAKITLY
jgi:hypothetical protein